MSDVNVYHGKDSVALVVEPNSTMVLLTPDEAYELGQELIRQAQAAGYKVTR